MRAAGKGTDSDGSTTSQFSNVKVGPGVTHGCHTLPRGHPLSLHPHPTGTVVEETAGAERSHRAQK